MLPLRWPQSGPLRIAFILTPVFLSLRVLWANPNWMDSSVHHGLRFDPRLHDLNTFKTKRELCKRHNLRPYDRKNQQRLVYDLFMINTEIKWPEIRLNATYDYVAFVVVESPTFFTNRDKALVIKEHLEKRLAAYRDKVIYHELETPEGFYSERANPAWAWEDLQRNAMYDQALIQLKGRQASTQGDVIVVADVDEILRLETLTAPRL